MRLILRNLVRRPGLVVSVVGMLVSALAFSSASLSVLNGLLIHPYPYPKLGQLLLVRDSKPAEGAHQVPALAAADFLDVRREVPAFSSVSGRRAVPAVLTSPGADPERVQALAVTANFFDTLGVTPVVGRPFAPDADTAGRDDVVLISRRLWSSRFGADASIVGRPIGVNGRPMTVAGIIRDEDCYPPGVDAWMPLVFSPSEASERALQRIAAIARLRDAATEQEAKAQLDALSSALAARYPATNRGRGFNLLPLRREQYEFTAPLFLFVQGAALLVLLMAVINVNNLLVARTLDRRRDLAIRAMLGASRTRVMATALGEVVALTAAAAVGGALVAPGVMQAIRASLPEGIARWIAGWSSLRVDAASLGAAAVIAMLIAIGLSAAVGLAGMRAIGATAESARATRRATWGRRGVIGGQVGLAAALLLAGSVMAAGFARLSAAFASLAPTEVLRFTLTLPEARYPDPIRIAAFHQSLLDALHALPEVETAALIRNEPASNVPNPVVSFQRDDGPILQPSERPRTDVEVVSPEAFAALRLSVLAGRALSDSDGTSQPRVGVISSTAARRFWTDRDPVGTSVMLGTDPQPIRIVGVVSDLTLNWYDPVARPILFLPDAQTPARTTTVIVRARTDPMAIARRVRAAVTALDDRQPVSELEPLSVSIADSLSPIRVIRRLLLVAAALAALLAAAGIYAVLAQWVGARARELGVRVALGATSGSIAGLVLREALVTAALGALAGTLVATAAVRAAGGLLFGVPSIDVGALALVAGGVFVLTLVASLGPARRAARVDVARLLRLD